MVDTVKISELPAVVSADGTSTFPVVQGGITKKETINQVGKQIQNGVFTFAVDTGVADAYVATLSPSVSPLTQGLSFNLLITHTNTGASTLNSNGTGVKAIVNTDGSPLVGNEMIAGGASEFIYLSGIDKYQLMNPRSSPADVGLGVATLRYVDTANGSNSNIGTEEFPWLGLNYAITQCLLQTPSATNIYTIIISGNISEAFELNPWINLMCLSPGGAKVTCTSGSNVLTNNNATWNSTNGAICTIYNIDFTNTGIDIEMDEFLGAQNFYINFINCKIPNDIYLLGSPAALGGESNFTGTNCETDGNIVIDSCSWLGKGNLINSGSITATNLWGFCGIQEIGSQVAGNWFATDTGFTASPVTLDINSSLTVGNKTISGAQAALYEDADSRSTDPTFLNGATAASNYFKKTSSEAMAFSTKNSKYVDPNYTGIKPTGSIVSPYATISAANTAITTNSLTNPFSINIAAGQLSESAAVLKPNTYWKGQGNFANVLLLSTSITPDSSWNSTTGAIASISGIKLGSGSLNLDFTSRIVTSGLVLLNDFENLGTSNFTSDISGQSIIYDLQDCILIGATTFDSCEFTVDTNTEIQNITGTTVKGDAIFNGNNGHVFGNVTLTASGLNSISGSLLNTPIDGNLTLNGDVLIYYDINSYPAGTVTTTSGAQFVPLPRPASVSTLNQQLYSDSFSTAGRSITPENGGQQIIVLARSTVAVTLTAPRNANAATSYRVYFIQDASGGRTPTWSTTINWAAGAAPNINLSPNAITIIDFNFIAATWFGEQVTVTTPIASVSGTTKTLAVADSNRMQDFTSNSPITVTLPKDATAPVPVGTFIPWQVSGTGQMTAVAESGATVNSNPGLKSNGQYAMGGWFKSAIDTWRMYGNTSA